MSKRRIMPAGHWDWSMPVTLSQGWRLGDLVVVGGQISADAKGRTVGGDIETQTRNIMEFIGRVPPRGRCRLRRCRQAERLLRGR